MFAQVASSAAQAGEAVGQVADGAQSQVQATAEVREKFLFIKCKISSIRYSGYPK